MKDRLLKTFSVNSNNEDITINIIETDKGIKVDISGTTMDVFVNGEEYYSKFDEEEYKYIPSHLRSFVADNKISDLEMLGSEITCDMDINDSLYNCLCIIPKTHSKNKYFSLRNWLIDYNLLGLGDETKKKESIKYNEFISQIENLGCGLHASHYDEEYDIWVDLRIPIYDFNLGKVEKCCQLWKEYNKYLIDTYLGGRY